MISFFRKSNSIYLFCNQKNKSIHLLVAFFTAKSLFYPLSSAAPQAPLLPLGASPPHPNISQPTEQCARSLHSAPRCLWLFLSERSELLVMAAAMIGILLWVAWELYTTLSHDVTFVSIVA
jgi:hypothetical protein